jgi:hypothetical protein
MRRAILAACLWLSAVGCAPAFENDPLAFGMTKDEVEHVLRSPLIYLSGRHGSERYLVQQRSSVPGGILYPVDTRVVLQFRRHRLTGWRRDWQMRPYWF